MLRLAAAGAVCAVLLAGCGGGGGDFGSQADRTCRALFGAPGAKSFTSDLTTLAQERARIERAIAPLARTELPDGERRRDAQTLLRVLRASARADVTTTASDVSASQIRSFNAAATRLGARACHVAEPTSTEPTTPDIPPPARLDATHRAQFVEGRDVLTQSGCLACHRIGTNGNGGPGPDLTHIASKLPTPAIRRTLRDPTAPMPSFKDLPREQLDALVAFLAALR